MLPAACKGFGTRAPQAAVTVTASPSWEEPVADLFAAYCNDCHGATPRNGAPPGIRTDLLFDAGGDLGVVALFDRHLARATDAGRPMPPPPDPVPTADEIAMLRTWASLGFPETVAEAQSAAPLPSGAACEPGTIAPCACVQGWWGWQPCEGESGYGTCRCDSSPGGVTADAGAASDGGAVADAGTLPDGGVVAPDAAAGPSLADLHASLLLPRCGGSECHAAGGASPPDLETAAGLRDRLLGPSIQARGAPYVVPGNPDASYLYVKCTPDFSSRGMGYGAVMPSDGSPLSSAELEQLGAWIRGGAAP